MNMESEKKNQAAAVDKKEKKMICSEF